MGILNSMAQQANSQPQMQRPTSAQPQAAQTVMEAPRPKPKENKDYFSPYPTGYGLD